MEKQAWWKESVVYQIYPKSFCDGNGDGIGDIKGIISKLDYLAWLGVDVVWISPMYPSPGYDNGYDISDYESIAPCYGSMEEFETLLKEAHARDVKVVIDLVVNHSSNEHPWFLNALEGREASKREYYIWRDAAPGGGPPNNWGALFGGPAWTRDEKSGQYYLNLFSSRQPDLNWENPALREQIYKMMRRWLDRGVDGFRMDVISLIAKGDDFSDGPAGKSGYHDPRARIAANPKVHEYLKEMKEAVWADRDVMTVGEASATTLENAVLFSNADGSELDMVFQFEHMDLDGGETFKWNDKAIPPAGLKAVMTKWQKGLYKRGWNALFWDNHDQPRMLSRLGDEGDLRETSAKMLAACLLMLQGTPFIFQGDELGMSNMRFTSPDQLRDSESINAYERYTGEKMFTKEQMLHYISLKSRDTARIPMQWNGEAGAGFTSGKPWMDVHPNHVYVNAKEQAGRVDSVLLFYKELIRIRHRHLAAVYGRYEPFETENEDVFAYFRVWEDETLYVCCNFTATAVAFPVPKRLRAAHARCLLGNVERSAYLEKGRLEAYEALILRLNVTDIEEAPRG
ncbi:MAG: alpha-glucosidase [Ruminococcus sp.]|nr:alpha-glucosidase [Ruminococcus sp.]